jgi:hypothetical protein
MGYKVLGKGCGKNYLGCDKESQKNYFGIKDKK